MISMEEFFDQGDLKSNLLIICATLNCSPSHGAIRLEISVTKAFNVPKCLQETLHSVFKTRLHLPKQSRGGELHLMGGCRAVCSYEKISRLA